MPGSASVSRLSTPRSASASRRCRSGAGPPVSCEPRGAVKQQQTKLYCALLHVTIQPILTFSASNIEWKPGKSRFI